MGNLTSGAPLSRLVSVPGSGWARSAANAGNQRHLPRMAASLGHVGIDDRFIDRVEGAATGPAEEAKLREAFGHK